MMTRSRSYLIENLKSRKRIGIYQNLAGLKAYLTAVLLFVSSNLAQAQQSSKHFPLIPYPTTLVGGTGGFSITSQTVIVVEDHKFDNEAAQLNALLAQYLSKALLKNEKSSGKVNGDAGGKAYGNVGGKAYGKRIVFRAEGVDVPEGYKLSITPTEIVLKAKDPAGMFRAVQTIRQLLPANEHLAVPGKSLFLPSVYIADQPAYAWRGMHLDVSRHFFSVQYLKKYIDLLALYKFNKLHLHLTDDQGWRIEIKKYPKLTEEGAWREFNNQDSACMVKAKDNPDFVIDPQHMIQKSGKTLYGGFYTQAEMKGIVAYATARHIDIIPEIDMPGHMMAAINSYPFLTYNGENKWGKLFTTPICPCKESTFEFAQNVFTEIMDIFPSKYIHIGGDEVDRSSWESSPVCKAFMEAHQLKTSAELQSYFINRMEKFFNAKGRQLIGWDEILEDGISPTAMVMYWRSWVPNAPLKAAKNGNMVVMSPGNPLYFDTQPDKTSIYNVYHFNPIPANLNAEQAKVVVGAQANTWAEMIPSENRADYMIFPRITALAERLWSNKDEYSGYLARLSKHYPRLDALGVHYRLPDIGGLVEQNVFTTETSLYPAKPFASLAMRYTLDGTSPTVNSMLLDKPLVIKEKAFIRLAAFTKQGSRGDVYNLHYKKQETVAAVQVPTVQTGLVCNFYPGSFKSANLMNGKPEKLFTVDQLKVPAEAKADAFGLKYIGYLNIPADGIYSFFLICDDGGILNIGGQEVVNSDGWHAPVERSGQVALKKGLQPFLLSFVEGGGGFTLDLKYSVNGSQPAEIPADWLKH
jgi:hexosaminidase